MKLPSLYPLLLSTLAHAHGVQVPYIYGKLRYVCIRG